jgi:hypothetical protein
MTSTNASGALPGSTLTPAIVKAREARWQALIGQVGSQLYRAHSTADLLGDRAEATLTVLNAELGDLGAQPLSR